MTHPTQPHPSDQPNPGYRPTLTEADPVGWYECRGARSSRSDRRIIKWWNGTSLQDNSENTGINNTHWYTDFRGPLTVLPEGWEEVVGWLSSICMWFEAELKDHVMGTPKTIDAWKMHSLLLEARAALAKLAAAEPTDAPREK